MLVGVSADPALAQVGADGSGKATSTRSYASRTAENLASLHRVAATYELVVNLYHQGLVEVVAAAGIVLERGQQPDATPSTALPAPAREVFRRIQRSLESRIPVASMPAAARGYHAEVGDALEQLRFADTLGEVPEPLMALVPAMRGFMAGAASILDLFSRERPVVVRVVDGNGILDEISEALDELAAAEATIAKLRRQRAGLAEQLQAFLRLEIALGHTLDLVALAEDAGLQFGFQRGLDTATLQHLAQRIDVLLIRLDARAQAIAAAPPQPPGVLRARVRSTETGPTLQLQWLPWPSDAHPRAVHLDVEGGPDVEALRGAREAALRCAGASPEEATTRAQKEVVAPAAMHLERLAPGRTLLAVSDPSWQQGPMQYRVVPVSAFGVRGPPLRVRAPRPPQPLAGVGWVHAAVRTPAVASPLFYRDAGRVRVTWGRSVSESTVRDVGVSGPEVRAYRVLRSAEGEVVTVGRTPPGTTTLDDFPPVNVLARRVVYSVVVEGAHGEEAVPPDGCPTAEVTWPEGPHALALAARGWGQPGWAQSYLQGQALRLENDPEALKMAWHRFQQEPGAQGALARWWQAQSVTQRVSWLERWPTLEVKPVGVSSSPLAPILSKPWQRDRAWLLTEAWLTQQDPAVQNEPDRWWSLLTTGERAVARHRWASRRGPAVQRWLRHPGGGAAAETHRRDRGIRVETWWRSRTPEAQAILETHWSDRAPETRARALQAWYAALPPVVQQDVEWPPWGQWSQAEQSAALANPPAPLPKTLQARFLAWQAYAGLTPAEQLNRAEAHVNLLARTWAGATYALRDVDRQLGFQLPVAVVLVLWALLVLTAVVWGPWRTLGPPRPLAGAHGLERLMSRSVQRSQPLRVVPGTRSLEALPTLGALLALGAMRARAAAPAAAVVHQDPLFHFAAADVLDTDLIGESLHYVGADPLALTAALAREGRAPGSTALLGAFGGEALLLGETLRRQGEATVAGTVALEPLADFHVTTDTLLIGEELYTARSYLDPQKRGEAALEVVDVLRWGLIVALGVGVVLASLGVISGPELSRGSGP